MQISEKCTVLLRRLKARKPTPWYHDAQAREEFARIIEETVCGSESDDTLELRVNLLKNYVRAFTPHVDEDDLLAGRCLHGGYCEYNEKLPCGHGHIVVDYGKVLRLGLPGLKETINRMDASHAKTAFSDTLDAFAMFIRRHAEASPQPLKSICISLLERAPQTFHEACQLVWFTQFFLHVEGLGPAAISYGRLDQYLGSFYHGTQEDFDVLCALFLKSCEGDESANLLVGGRVNRLSYDVLKAMTALNIWQPSISVDFSPETPQDFKDAAYALTAIGSGMPSYFNGPVVRHSLETIGYTSEESQNWTIVGCYEASGNGNSWTLSVAGHLSLSKLMAEYWAKTPIRNDFNAFYSGYKEFVRKHYLNVSLPSFRDCRRQLAQTAAMPFESICVDGCIENGRLAEWGGACHNQFGVNIMGLGTVVDSLWAIHENASHNTARTMTGKFGSGNEFTDNLAAELAAWAAHLVMDNPIEEGVYANPGLFWFGKDINQHEEATPDGRLDGERLSYGCGPSELLRAPRITTILSSVAKLPHALFSNGNPLVLTLDSVEHLPSLVETYFRMGGFHLAFNLVDASTLREAMDHPEQFPDLMVKVSGFSALFVTIDKKWQQALVDRAIRKDG